MLDGVTLDQLRTFIAAVDEGSFSAAGRKLGRAQSVVSQTLANLEAQIGVTLFDRSSRYPKLTEHGAALLRDARLVANGVDGFKAKARSLSEGLEPELSVAVDVMYPMGLLTRVVEEFRDAFPETSFRLYVEALGGVVQPVVEKCCRLGVVGTLPEIPVELVAERLFSLPLVTVVAPSHPLAARGSPVTQSELEQHVQLVLTDRTPVTAGQSFGVASENNWRLADLGAKYAFLKAGLGWGHMPRSVVEEDIKRGFLKEISLESVPQEAYLLSMSAVYRRDAPPGPAGRWFIDRLGRG